MGKPEKKLKKMILIVGITGAVYGSFRFLLPLVLPFFIAWGLAAALRPSALWIEKKSRLWVSFGKKRRLLLIPAGAAGAAELLGLFAVGCAFLYWAGRKLAQEAWMLMDRIPEWTRRADQWLTGWCRNVEGTLCLERGVLAGLVREMLSGMLISMKEAAMPRLMVNSVTLFRWGAGFLVLSAVVLIGVGLCIQEMDAWKKKCRESVFGREYALIGTRLTLVIQAYVKTQAVIMAVTACVCTIGFWALGNPYCILAGAGIGILDALPVFGTGTVLIPWGIVSFFQGAWGRGMGILLLYAVCYLVRETLEARLMGSQVGLSPLETLIAVYVGLGLFGIPGLFLGPVGLLLIRDLAEEWEGDG